MEGAKTLNPGLNAEQYASVELDQDIFADYDVKTSYEEHEGEDGIPVIKPTFNGSDTIHNALVGQRMGTGFTLTSNGELCRIDGGNPLVIVKAGRQWTKYLNTGNVMEYESLLNAEESEQYSKISTAGMDYQSQNVPNVIKGTMSWEDYVKGFEKIDTKTAVSLLQKYVDAANASEE